MKGFLYLIETAVAAVLVAVILSSVFAAQYSGSDWTRADLVGTGNNIFDMYGESILLTLNSTQIFDEIDTLKPPNVKYTFRFRGIPKSRIMVGTNNVTEVSKYLGPSYINERVIEYDITGFNPGDSIDDFDILVLTDYNGYNRTEIEDFSENKFVIGIESDESDADGFLEYFSLVDQSAPALTELEFNNYDDITKYFLGIGFVIKTTTGAGAGLSGIWEIRNANPALTISASPKVCIDPSGVPTCTPDVGEREILSYDRSYLVKDINYGDFSNSWVKLGVKGTNFNFAENFTGGHVDTTEFSEKLIGDANYAAMSKTKYANRIWISKSGNHDTEYKALVQAAVASSVMDWYMEEPESTKSVEVSRYVGLCCDIPETAEISMVLWYVF